MVMEGGLTRLLNYLVSRYIIFHLENPPSLELPLEIEHVQDETELIRTVNEIPQIEKEMVAIDGSSRSHVFSQGIVSLSSVSAFSSTKGIKGMFPSFNEEMSLELNEPFIALATPYASTGRIEDFLLHPLITKLPMNEGSFQVDLSRLEMELRFSLETACLSKFRNSPLVLVDGPLIPRFIYLDKSVVRHLIDRRKKIIGNNFVGIVKRVNTSTTLLNALKEGKMRNYFMIKYKIDPISFSNDEAFIIHLIEKNFKPPFKPLIIGPVSRQIEDVEITSSYLVIPFHPFTKKFSILRAEYTQDSVKPEELLSIPMSADGIPIPLALADKSAKEMSEATFNLLIQELIRDGIQSAFYSRLEGMRS
ncbi:MAG: DNA double-strand break repair nuclease NurA [Metallosphaera sp.]|uniref:NurA domain-containing protein n=2 Tax=Sulfolobaceae TaxID=118883 RepID=F4FYS8_METCR|nr:conserved hypothetical protein [Metallosphaera cuprina Ar-4]